MRRLLTLSLVAAVAAACSTNAPSATPIRPWSPGGGVGAPSAGTSGNGAASAAPSQTPRWNWTCQPTIPSTDPATWVPVTPESQGFSILLPGPALETSRTTATPLGSVQALAWAFLDGCHRTYGVSHLAFPAGALSKAGPTKDVLDGIVASQPQSEPDTVLTSQTDVTINGHPARRYLLTAPDYVVDGLFVVAGDHLFQVGLWYGTQYPPPAGVLDAFFASFQVTV
jgi:hypothetical protein